MAILAKCNMCRRAQSNKNKICCECGNNLKKAKEAKKIRFVIRYRHNSKQKSTSAKTFDEAKAIQGKIDAAKYEKSPYLDTVESPKMTLAELFDWFLALVTVMELVSYRRIKACLNNVSAVLGTFMVNQVKAIDLENYQNLRKEKGRAPATIDMELKYAKTAVKKAFDNDKISAAPLKAFNNTKKMLKNHSNSRDRKLSFTEYLALLNVSPPHLESFLIIAFNTGMRAGEIVNLKREYIDKQKGMIMLPASVTKEGRKKRIPINHHVQAVLNQSIPCVHHNYVVTYKSHKLKEGASIRKSFTQACKVTGIPYGTKVKNGITPRDIRTTVKTNMLEAKIGKTVRDVIFGHSLKGMDAYYIKLGDDALIKAMELYTKWLDSQLDDVVNNLKNVGETQGG